MNGARIRELAEQAVAEYISGERGDLRRLANLAIHAAITEMLRDPSAAVMTEYMRIMRLGNIDNAKKHFRAMAQARRGEAEG